MRLVSRIFVAICVAAFQTAVLGDAVPPCSPGVTASFYDLTKGQAQYLSGQFPFIQGPGQLISTLTPTETLVLPQINFASPAMNTSGP